jgi:NADH-quinone oxidoreductase subunit L
VMWLPMVILSGLSVFVWFSFNPVHASSGWFLSWLGVLSEHHSSTIPVISVIITALSITAAYKQANSEKGFSSLPQFLGKVTLQRVKQSINLQSRLLAEHSEERAVKEFFLIPVLQVANLLQYLEVKVINAFVDGFAKFTVVLSHIVTWLDKNVVDGGVRLTAFTATLLGSAGRRIQNGKIQSYFLVTTLSLVLLVLWWLII